MQEVDGTTLVRQAVSQAAVGALPAEIFSMLFEKLVAAGNYPVAGVLYQTWRDNLGPDFPVSPEQDESVARTLDTLKAHLPDL